MKPQPSFQVAKNTAVYPWVCRIRMVPMHHRLWLYTAYCNMRILLISSGTVVSQFSRLTHREHYGMCEHWTHCRWLQQDFGTLGSVPKSTDLFTTGSPISEKCLFLPEVAIDFKLQAIQDNSAEYRLGTDSTTLLSISMLLSLIYIRTQHFTAKEKMGPGSWRHLVLQLAYFLVVHCYRHLHPQQLRDQWSSTTHWSSNSSVF